MEPSTAPVGTLPTSCIICKHGDISYTTNTCNCPVYCKKCAMKLASGGKCKLCTAWYTGFRRL